MHKNFRRLFFLAICPALYPVLLAKPAFAGPPFVTDDPEPVDQGHWEVNGFASGTTVRGDQSGMGPAVEVNYGAAPDLQLHVIVPLAYDRPAGRDGSYGMGDIEIGAKYRFLDADNQWGLPEMATFPTLELPSGDAARGLGSGHVRAYLPIWLQKSWGSWTSYGGGGYWINPGQGNRDSWFSGVVLQDKLTDHLVLGGEIFHQTPTTAGGAATTGFNAGVIYDFSDHYHLLLSAGRGLQNADLTNRFSYYAALQLTF